MDGGKRPVVAGVHCLKHVEHLVTSYFAHNDSIRPHSQTVFHKIPLGDFTRALNIGRSCFETHHMLLFKLKLRGIFNRDNALAAGNKT
jgi:hypothetical protein